MEHEQDVNERLARIEIVVADIRDAIVAIARLDQKHIATSEALTRAFAVLEKVEARVQKLESAMPVVQLASGWVFRGVLAVMVVVGLAVIALVLK